ncbi:MAG TPA: protoheme IX farnesyltransferase, partial [Thioploca sp.]|nr:protoheme IX farnesyltransferase [Thioploca sp.]
METISPNNLSISWKKYIELCKPKVVVLIVFTAIVGMLLSTHGALVWQTMIFAILGIGLASASGAAINQLVERKIDAIMERT